MCYSIYAFLVDECTRPSMTVKHFEASLALQAEDSVEVIYRIPFPQMTNFRIIVCSLMIKDAWKAMISRILSLKMTQLMG